MTRDPRFDGHRLAREIDSANPAEPLPYLRERPTLDSGTGVLELASTA